MPSTEIISLSEREFLIRGTALFRDLSINEIIQLASIMQEVSVSPGEVVVKEGELIDSVFIIASGTLEVTNQIIVNGKAGSTFVALLNPGESIGLKDIGLYTKTGRRTATVTAETPCVLLKINIKDFDAFLDKHPQTLQSMKETTDVMLRMQFIKESNPFVHLSNQRIAWLASAVKTIQVNEGEIIFKQNDPVDNCYMVVEGIVEISAQKKSGDTKIVDTLKAGALFGEQAMFKNAKRVTTARAATACRLMVLDQDTLEELKEETEGDISDTIFSQTSEYNQPKRLENIIHHHRRLGDGQVITTLKDPVHNQYLQLNDEGWYIWQLLNGEMTIQEITQQFSKHYKRFDPQTVIATINTFVDAGFAKADVMQSDIPIAGKKRAEGMNLADRFQWVYAIKNPDAKMTKLYQYFGFIFFSIPVVILIVLSILAGIILLPNLLGTTFLFLHKAERLYIMLIWIVFLSMTFRLINPLAKALTIKYFGHVVPHFTLGLRFLFPVAFVDTSDLWASSRFSRSMTLLSGIIATLLVASLLTIFVYYRPQSFFAFSASMCALVLYFLALRSLDPLLDSDGYLALVSALDAHKLRESALSGFKQNVTSVSLKRKTDYTQRNRKIYYLYYIIYVLLNFLFLLVIHEQVRPFGLRGLWNNGLIYILVFVGLVVELLIELDHERKRKQMLAAE